MKESTQYQKLSFNYVEKHSSFEVMFKGNIDLVDQEEPLSRDALEMV